MGLLWQTVRTALRGTQVRSRVQYVAGVLEVLALGYSKYSRWGTLSARAGVVQVLALRGTQVRSRVQYVAQIDLAGQLIGGLSQQWMQKRMGCLG